MGADERLTAALAWAGDEYRQCIVAARCTTDGVYYAQVNGRAEAYRQLADLVAEATELAAPDWEGIKRSVPADGIYRTTGGEAARVAPPNQSVDLPEVSQ